jgi:uncharacterized protein (TIGR02271 family)
MEGRADYNNKEDLNDSLVVPVIEEQLIVNKELIETGKVLIKKMVESTNEDIRIPLVEEEVEVERKAINQFIDPPPPASRYEGEKLIIPVLKEVVVKRLILVEELHITKKRSETEYHQEVNLNKEKVVVERKDSAQE